MTVLLWRIGMLLVMAIMTKSTSTFSIAPPVKGTPSPEAENWDPDRYSTNAAFVSELGKNVLLNSLGPESGERILDIGCGDGALTIELQERGCRVIGIDFAPEMIAAAVERGVEAYVMDASSIDAPFLLSKINGCDDTNNASFDKTPTTKTEPSSPSCGDILDHQGEDQGATALANSSDGKSIAFDAVFTNAVFHWIKRPRTAIEGVKQVLRPGGRFVGEFGGHGNIAAIRVAIHAALRQRGIDPIEVDPWYYPAPKEFRLLLEAAEFIVDDIALVPRPTVLPRGTGMRGWLATFARTFLNTLPNKSDDDDGSHKVDANGLTKAQNEMIDEVLGALQPALRDESGLWTADYVRLKFRAHLPYGRCIE